MMGNIKKTGFSGEQICGFKLFIVFTFVIFVIPGCNLQNTVQSNIVTVDDLVPEATQIIRGCLVDENPYLRVNAVEVVAATRQIKLMPIVQRLLNDAIGPVRFASALAVGDLKYRLAEDSVEQMLNDTDENVRIAVAYALFKLGKTNNFSILSQAITSPNQTVRANVALLLGKSDDKRAIKLLYQARDDGASDDRVRFQAVQSLAMLGDEKVFLKLWAMLISIYADDRLLGVEAMGMLGTAQAKNALITKLNDEVLEIRLAAAEQLGMLGDTTGEPEVLSVFTKNLTAGLNKQDIERVNIRTALAIGRVGTASLTRFLQGLLRNESKIVRLTAAKAVFMCKNKN